jgi:hypothetical protein
MTREDRQNILTGINALRSLCLKIERESKHCQETVWRGKPITITWGLDFDDYLLVFEPHVLTIPAVCSQNLAGEQEHSQESRSCLDWRMNDDLLELNTFLENQLIHLKDHESWPTVIPDEWLVSEKSR